MKKILCFLIIITCMAMLLLSSCDALMPKIDFPDITMKYGEEVELPTSVNTGLKNETVEYSYSGNNISIEYGILKALVAETTTVVTVKYGNVETEFKVIVLLGDKVDVPSDEGNSPDDGGEDSNEDEKPVDKGTMIIDAPKSIYSNYSGKEIKVTFTNPEYASDVTFTTNNSKVTVNNGIISATGMFNTPETVTVTAVSEHHEPQRFTIEVSNYDDGINIEKTLLYYEQNIIKEENKGGLIFIGDSYFSGQLRDGKPSFWSDFYEDYADEKAFLLGISQAQIDNLEIVSERIVYPMEPKEIVLHIGFNDVHSGTLSTDELYSRIVALCEKYKEQLPDVKIYFMGIEPKKNGYTEGTQYYMTSTLRAPIVTDMIKAYAEEHDWFIYLETMPVFVDSNGVIKQSSYLSTDLSHPTLPAYDEIREIINEARAAANAPADPDQPSDGDGTGDTPVVDPEDPNGGTQTPENPGGGTEIPDAPVDYGTFSVEAPSSIYSNYAGKEIKVTFSNPDYATEVTYVTDNANVFVENGKIYATGVYEEAFSVTVTASTQYHEAQTFTVNVSTFTGDVQAETKVQYYEEYIIKEENKGGIIFVGDSYFDGYKIEKPPFWSDFYSDFPNEKAFLMGISSSQIDDLEVVSERIVYPMEPKEIVVHIGFNDVHHGPLTVDELYARITALCEKYKEALPDVKIYFIGVEPKKNGYTAGTAYYNSSTVKAPELTARIKEYAESKDWFTYVDTMSVFVDSNGVIKQSSYLSTDLSHPTLAAYDEIRAILNEVRGVENYVPSITDDPNAHYIKNYGVGGDINSVGKYYTAADGSALTNNYIISGTLTVTASNASAKPHIQFRFSQGFRFLLWDADMDGKLGAGYIATGLTTKNDKTPGAVLFDATSELTLNWSIVVDNGKAYWFINNTLLEKFDSPTLQYFNVGALEMDLAIYDVDLTVKSENEEEYNARFAEYNKIIMAVADPNALLINSYGNSSNINGTGKNYTDANGAALTNNYAIKGTLAITAINKSNAHLQFRFSSGYRFLLWDSSNDGVLGAGYTATGLANKNDKTAGAALFDANSLLVLDWAVVVNNGKAYWYINGTLMETFDNPVLEFFNIGALQMNVAVYNVELAVKSENETAYNAFLSEYGIK
ncbi:MAG: SGNH/GDSL hydrolase family protein [Clostridia bacterium]|nr:SGNH/GDSL hydrolase family protein [Clostridia bacterium]